MFAIARILIGFAIAGVALICPAYVAETLPPHWRATGLGILNSIFYIGTLRRKKPRGILFNKCLQED